MSYQVEMVEWQVVELDKVLMGIQPQRGRWQQVDTSLEEEWVGMWLQVSVGVWPRVEM